MQTTESKSWNDGDEIYGIVLSCSNGYENRGVRQYRRSEFDVLKVGSAPDCHLRDECMASCHALFELRERKVLVRVVDNVSGVLKNGQRVYGEAPVLDNDELRLGDFRIKLKMMRLPLTQEQIMQRQEARREADRAEWENNRDPYHHQQTMLSLIEEFKQYYPDNTEILKIEKLAHYDDGRDRDARHKKMLRQLVASVRSARQYARSNEILRDAIARAEEERATAVKEIERLANEMLPAFKDLSMDELVEEALRLTARMATGGNMTEALIEMLDDKDSSGEDRSVFKLLLDKHQENSRRDGAAFLAVTHLIKKGKKEEQ